MKDFLSAYAAVVLDNRGLDLLTQAYARLGESDDVRDRHRECITTIILPAANRLGLTGLGITKQCAFRVFQMFRPSSRRGADPEFTVGVNRQVLDYLRRYLRDETAISEEIDLAFFGSIGRAYVNHLARELLVWCYVVEHYGQMDADTLREVEQEAAPHLHEGWRTVLTEMVNRIASDLRAQPPVIKGPDILTGGEIAELPDELDFAQMLDEFLRELTRAIIEEGAGAGANRRAALFPDRLLLRFAITACSHIHFYCQEIQSAIHSEILPRRACLVSLLSQLGLEKTADVDVGDQLGWLDSLRHKGELLGDEFRADFSASVKQLVEQRFALRKSTLWKSIHNELHKTSTETPDAKVSTIWREMVGLDEHSIATLRLALADDLKRLCSKMKRYEGLEEIFDSPAEPDAVELEIEDRAWLDQQLSALQGYLSEQYRRRYCSAVANTVKKYFTTLRRPRMGDNSSFTLRSREWTEVAQCTWVDAHPSLRRYANVWRRIGGRPHVYLLTEVQHKLSGIAPDLEPIVGFDKGGVVL